MVNHSKAVWLCKLTFTHQLQVNGCPPQTPESMVSGPGKEPASFGQERLVKLLPNGMLAKVLKHEIVLGC